MDRRGRLRDGRESIGKGAPPRDGLFGRSARRVILPGRLPGGHAPLFARWRAILLLCGFIPQGVQFLFKSSNFVGCLRISLSSFSCTSFAQSCAGLKICIKSRFILGLELRFLGGVLPTGITRKCWERREIGLRRRRWRRRRGRRGRCRLRRGCRLRGRDFLVALGQTKHKSCYRFLDLLF